MQETLWQLTDILKMFLNFLHFFMSVTTDTHHFLQGINKFISVEVHCSTFYFFFLESRTAGLFRLLSASGTKWSLCVVLDSVKFNLRVNCVSRKVSREDPAGSGNLPKAIVLVAHLSHFGETNQNTFGLFCYFMLQANVYCGCLDALKSQQCCKYYLNIFLIPCLESF